jgi:hypothetical protein
VTPVALSQLGGAKIWKISPALIHYGDEASSRSVRSGAEAKGKTNKHESDDMLVNYDFIICHDTQIYYDNMCGSSPSASALLLTHTRKKRAKKTLKMFTKT